MEKDKSCIGCGEKDHELCPRCEHNINELERVMKENDLEFTKIEVR